MTRVFCIGRAAFGLRAEPRTARGEANQHQTFVEGQGFHAGRTDVEVQLDVIFTDEQGCAGHIRIDKQGQLALFPCEIENTTVEA